MGKTILPVLLWKLVMQIFLQETLLLLAPFPFMYMIWTLLCLYHYYLAVPCFNFALSLTCILHFSFFKYHFLPCFCLYHIQLYLSSLLICTLLLSFSSRYDLYLALSLSLPSCTFLLFWSVLCSFLFPLDMICTLLCLYLCPAVPCLSFDLYFASFFPFKCDLINVAPLLTLIKVFCLLAHD